MVALLTLIFVNSSSSNSFRSITEYCPIHFNVQTIVSTYVQGLAYDETHRHLHVVITRNANIKPMRFIHFTLGVQFKQQQQPVLVEAANVV